MKLLNFFSILKPKLCIAFGQRILALKWFQWIKGTDNFHKCRNYLVHYIAISTIDNDDDIYLKLCFILEVVHCLATPECKSQLLKPRPKSLLREESTPDIPRLIPPERKHPQGDKWVHGECKCPSDITYCPRWQPQPWRWKVWTTYFNGWHTSPKIINHNRFLPRQKASRLSSAAVVRLLVKSLNPIPADFCQKLPYPPPPTQPQKIGNLEGLLRSLVLIIGQTLF